jgi:hypothetical protein
MAKENEIIEVRVGDLTGIPWEFEIIETDFNTDILENRSCEEIKEWVRNLRGWARMLLNKKIKIKKLK